MERSDSRDKIAIALASPIYCLKCKTKTDTLEIEQNKSRNNRLMLQGKCALCGTTKSRFASAKESASGNCSFRAEGKGWTDLPFELHPQVSLTKRYSFVGPGTKLNKRLDENKNPLSHSKPVNKLDEIAMNHDICYEKYSDTKERNKICDKKMLDDIKSNRKTSSINEWIMRRAANNIIGSKKVLGI